jgi:hypothetical protein
VGLADKEQFLIRKARRQSIQKKKKEPFATSYTQPVDDRIKMSPKHVEAW